MIPKLWQTKYLAQKILQLVPGGFAINRYMQKKMGNLRQPTIYGIKRILTLMQALELSGYKLKGKKVVELGTGYDMSAPMMIQGFGAESISTYDLRRLVTNPLLEHAKSCIVNRTNIYEDCPIPFETKPDWWIEQLNFDAIDTAAINYNAPSDARQTGIGDNTIDLYYSLAVLEHIPETIIEELLAESFRILKPGGICYHYVQPHMHAASIDKKASSVDFLAIPTKTWERFYENDIAHENRLRGVEYMSLLKNAGFEITNEWHTVNSRGLEKLPHLKLDRRFEKFSDEELATDYIWVIARKPAA